MQHLVNKLKEIKKRIKNLPKLAEGKEPIADIRIESKQLYDAIKDVEQGLKDEYFVDVDKPHKGHMNPLADYEQSIAELKRRNEHLQSIINKTKSC